MEELYRVFSKGVRFYLLRHLGPQDLEDRLHDVFLIITQSIQRGDLREPDRLMGYVRTIVRRQVAAHIDSSVQARRNMADLDAGISLTDHRPDPEHSAIERQNLQLALRVLNSIARRDREVLVRFYLREQPPDQICRDLDLTENQFRLIKSRAKARFGELGKRRFSLRAGFRRDPQDS
jgi:RNA polymerase sigma-70 factor (ECF subfamily)